MTGGGYSCEAPWERCTHKGPLRLMIFEMSYNFLDTGVTSLHFTTWLVLPGRPLQWQVYPTPFAIERWNGVAERADE